MSKERETLITDLSINAVDGFFYITQKLQSEIRELLTQPEQELETLVKDFFENYLDTWEESDSGREFHPITISCCRCMKVEPLDKLLTRMRELSDAKSPYEIGSSM